MAKIRKGTGIDKRDGSMYRWAQTDRWRMVYWPETAGVEVLRKIHTLGWYLDDFNEIPPGAYEALAEAIGAPDFAR